MIEFQQNPRSSDLIPKMTTMRVWTKSGLSRAGKRSVKEMIQNQKGVKKNLWFRLLYSIGCLGYFGGCLYQTWSFLAIYFEYPTSMEVNVFQQAIVNFPAVTVCNGNRVRKTHWCHLNSLACKPVPKDIGEAQTYITELQESYKYINRTQRIAMAHQKEDFIRSCQFEDRNCFDLIGQYFNYEYTNCFTINGRWANKSAKPLSATMFRPRSGRSSELSIMLNVEREEYSPMNPVVRARLTIHSTSTIPNPQYDGVSLQPGRTYNYGVRKSILNVLPSPYQTNCKNYTGLKERRSNASLTQEDCMSECCAYSHLDHCNCTVHRLSLIYDIPTCWKLEEENCLKQYEDEIKKQCLPQCGMPCSKITYDYLTVDSFALQQGACKSEDLYNKSLTKKDRENLICLRVYISSAESEIYNFQPKYDAITVFSVLGGYIGLWLGISFLDVHSQAVKFLYMCTGKKENQKARVKSIRKKVIHYHS